MSFERRSLAGKDKDGTPRGGPERYSAAGLLERLRRYAPHANEALRHTAETWAKVRSQECIARGLKEGAYHSQERVFMQVLGLGLELSTSHHPALITVFPLLLAWIREALGYVVELEGLVEAGEREISGLESELGDAERVRLKQAEIIEAKCREVERLERELMDAAVISDRERVLAESRTRDLQRDLAAAIETRDAWKVSAQASAITVNALSRGVRDVIDMEVVSDGPQLPAVRS